MKRRTFIQTGATAVAIAALPFGSALSQLAPMPKSRRNIHGSDMAYVDQGSGRPIVFLHGNPTSSYLWRNIIPYVTDTHRAIAPDMIGMGDSAKPDIDYTYEEQAAHLHGLLDELDLRDAVLVVHDWGSGLGFHYARTRPERVSGIVFMESTVPPFFPIPSYEALGPFEEFLRGVSTDGVGEEMVLKQNVFIDQSLRAGGTNKPLSDAIMAECNRPFPTPESRKPVLQWPREIPIAGEPENVFAVADANNKWLVSSEVPKLLFHVSPGAMVPPQVAQHLEANVKNLEMVHLGPVGHFVQEDYPDEIGKGIADWLKRN